MEVDGADGIQETKEPHDRGGDQHVRVEAEPRKVEGDLDAVVAADVVERLVSKPNKHQQF